MLDALSINYSKSDQQLHDAASRKFRTDRDGWDKMAWGLWRLSRTRSHLLMTDAVVARIKQTAKREGGEVFVDPEGKFRVEL